MLHVLLLLSITLPPGCNDQKPKTSTGQYCGNVANENCASINEYQYCNGIKEDRVVVHQDCEANTGTCCEQQTTLCYKKWSCTWNEATQKCQNNVLIATVTTQAKVQGTCCIFCGGCFFPG